MKLDDMLNQQKNRGIKQAKIKAKMQSYDDYVNDDLSPRPYNTPNVADLVLPKEKNNQNLTIFAAETSEIRHAPNKSSMLRIKYQDLTGNEKKIVDEIAYQCVIHKSGETDFIDKNIFSQRTSVKLGAIKTTVRRLKHKGVLINYVASKGRHSAWRFILSDVILEQYISSRSTQS